MSRPISKKQFLDLWWKEFCPDKSMSGDGCMLCGFSGEIDTRGRFHDATGKDIGGVAFCICPKGRGLKARTDTAAARQRREQAEEKMDALAFEAPHQIEPNGGVRNEEFSMANWCENEVRISVPDETTARAFFDATKAGRGYRGVKNVISTDDDVPADFDDGDRVRWNDEHRAAPGIMTISGASILMRWCSRWNPPIEFFDQLTAHGFVVDAMYLEPDMSFCGFYRNGQQTNVNYENRSDIPAEIEASWGKDFFDWLFEDA